MSPAAALVKPELCTALPSPSCAMSQALGSPPSLLQQASRLSLLPPSPFLRGGALPSCGTDSQIQTSRHRSSSVKVFAAFESNYNSGYTPRRPRREPLPNVSELDLQEQVAAIDMDPNKMMQPGDPNGMQAVIRDVMPVGYFVTLPTGRDGYLPAQDLGFNGGLALLQRLFKEGQEITVRIVCRGGAGREIVSVKKPEFAPPSEQKTIESMRLHFENERKGANRPRRR